MKLKDSRCVECNELYLNYHKQGCNYQSRNKPGICYRSSYVKYEDTDKSKLDRETKFQAGDTMKIKGLSWYSRSNNTWHFNFSVYFNDALILKDVIVSGEKHEYLYNAFHMMQDLGYMLEAQYLGFLCAFLHYLPKNEELKDCTFSRDIKRVYRKQEVYSYKLK